VLLPLLLSGLALGRGDELAPAELLDGLGITEPLPPAGADPDPIALLPAPLAAVGWDAHAASARVRPTAVTVQAANSRPRDDAGREGGNSGTIMCPHSPRIRYITFVLVGRLGCRRGSLRCAEAGHVAIVQ
jgi:hypothetical protein